MPPHRYRLPNENEWEHACRGGSVGRFCYGDDTAFLQFFARAQGEATEFHRVAEFMPNPGGLFDMHGGLWETCDTEYPSEFLDKTHSPDATWIVQRGGAYHSPARRCRTTQRNYFAEASSYSYRGVRLVVEMLP